MTLNDQPKQNHVIDNLSPNFNILLQWTALNKHIYDRWISSRWHIKITL